MEILEMMEFPEDKTLPGGSWYLWKTGKLRVFLCCPLCTQVVMIDPEEIEIMKDGRISKIIGCPKPGCDFRDAVRLVGWCGEEPSSGTIVL